MMAALLFFAGLPLLQPGRAAAAQLSTRSITISDSTASGGSITSGVGSGLNVTYRVAFTATAQTSSMVIDFCSEDPIINDTCTTPTSFTAVGATLTNTTSTGQVGVAANNWTVTNAAGRVKLADDGVSGHDIQASSNQKFELNAITNTSTVGTFYARMYTYTNTTWGTYASATSIGNFVDYGGIAMSTTNVITITARVQEQLTFCVTKADPATWITNNDCSDPTVASNLPALTLGHGSPTPILTSNQVDTGSIWTQLSTNATNGAVIKMRNGNLTCGGLSADSGTTCAIPAINAGATGTSNLVAGTAGFGLYADTYTPTSGIGTTGAGGIGTIGSLTPTLNYNDTTHTALAPPVYYGMDNTTAGNNITSTYGSTVASTASPVYRADNQYIFAATSALTTPAGIYTANLSMIATGTF